jgi:nucleoside-diphosphate-sugar epimerase
MEIKMKNVALVFGGGGFIGSHLLKNLSETGKYERLVSADIAEPRFRVAEVEYKQVDVREPIADEVCPDANVIYNLAAVHTTPGHQDWEYYWTNVLGAIHVADYARKHDVKKIVFTSSISVYGPTESPKTEESLPAPESAYGKSKLAAEKVHRYWLSEGADRKLVVVRPAVIYGLAERGNFTRLASLLNRGLFFYPGRRDTIKSCGYVEDLVASFDFMLARPERDITYNFAHAERYTSADICAAFHDVAGYKKSSPVVPLAPMLAAAWGFEMLGKVGFKTSINRPRIMKLNQSTNVIPKVLTEFGFPYRFDLKESLIRWRSMSATGAFD